MNNLNKKVLIVEDDVDIANLIKDYLEINNFEAIICDDGKKVLNIIEEEKIGCILLDLMLPNISGFEICKEIRQSYLKYEFCVKNCPKFHPPSMF